MPPSQRKGLIRMVFDEPGLGPAMCRRLLSTELRRLRQRHNLEQYHVADAMDWSVSKVSRIEKGVNAITVTDLHALLRLYKVTGSSQVSRLVEWARRARHRGWWSRYKLSSPYHNFIGLEVDAAGMEFYELGVVPGLAQTGAYAQALIEAASFGTLSAEEIDRLVAVRLDRQRTVLHRPDPPGITIIIDESALHRSPGERWVLPDQLQHLGDLAELPHLILRILPGHLIHPGLIGSFCLLELPEEAGKLVFIETYRDNLTLDAESDVQYFQQAFEHLAAMAFSPDQSVDLIHKIREQVT